MEGHWLILILVSLLLTDASSVSAVYAYIENLPAREKPHMKSKFFLRDAGGFGWT